MFTNAGVVVDTESALHWTRLIVGLSLIFIYRFLLLYFEMSFMSETKLFCVAILHHVGQ